MARCISKASKERDDQLVTRQWPMRPASDEDVTVSVLVAFWLPINTEVKRIDSDHNIQIRSERLQSITDQSLKRLVYLKSSDGEDSVIEILGIFSYTGRKNVKSNNCSKPV